MLDTVQKTLASIDWQSLGLSGVRAIGVLVLAWVALFIVRLTLRRFARRLIQKAVDDDIPESEASKRAETLTRLLRQAITIAVWAVAMITALSELGVDIGPILASAGIVGLAVGFGAQNLVRDVISGFFLVLEDQVRVGDVATVNGTGGLVERVGLRTVILRDMTGTVHVFPNGTITTLSNLTKDWSAYVFDIGIAYKEDPDRAIEIMKRIGTELRGDAEIGGKILEELEVFGVDALEDSSVTIKARFKTQPIEQWAVGREYLRRLKAAFDAEGIEIPFPHRSLNFGESGRPIEIQVVDQRAG